MRALARRRVLLVLASALLVSGCGPTVDLTKGLQIELVSTGWLDAGLVNGKNKLVPAVMLRLKNVSDQKLVALQVNAVFHRANEKEQWGQRFLTVAGSEGLAPGATTATLTIKSDLGYTGTESRDEMLQNTAFVDASVNLSSKYGSAQWVPVGPAPLAISRQLMTP